MQHLLHVCMDSWEHIRRGDGHTLWTRTSSKLNTGEAAPKSAAVSRRKTGLLGCPTGCPDFSFLSP